MALWQQIALRISATNGEQFELETRQAMAGGCINQAYRLKGERGKSYFVKLNQADSLPMFEAEVMGLQELAQADAIRVPAPVCSGMAAGQAFLVLEDLSLGGAGSMAAFARQLAQMHHYTRQQFGWHCDNTIGSTTQINTPNAGWIEFWRERRLGFQLQLAAKNGAAHSLLDKGQKLLQGFDCLFSDYQPVASLLHGDLWSGNYAFTRMGEAVIFDPAVYYGDRETDIAMSELFGGFPADFYAAYEEAWPLDTGYAVRRTLYNLYHILNHFNLFGGGYAAQAEGMIERLLAEC
ncbi:Ribulosamine/erythrulosamine 3-kinase potentially involved in protein deglycation [hydrothermal vent metagenome]|uniref:Ribulosamine/erythrulosamine 3-kinase potentially involved in protein deglycation n=1 Tax=hydrothermal vent metagenome TaxID=652676 RepID=A0A3B1BP53_9ZZZZ